MSGSVRRPCHNRGTTALEGEYNKPTGSSSGSRSFGGPSWLPQNAVTVSEEPARRGDAIYEKDILPKLAAKDVGKFLAIDIETGEYEMAADEMKAGDKLRARLPEAQIWMVRVGYASTRSFGGRQVRQELP